MFGFKLLGKTHVPHCKNTAETFPVRMTPPKSVLLPTSQHIGAPAQVTVKVGDEVKVGQLVAEAAGNVSANVYASVSGKVVGIENYLTPAGKTVPAVRIESDGLMTVADGIAPREVCDLDSLIEAARDCGLVGLGGAGFPTAVKLEAAKSGAIKSIVINGAECEPYITSDTRTMLDRTDDVCFGIELLEKCIPSVEKILLAIEKNKPSCINKLNDAFAADERVKIVPLPPKYPRGAERVVVYNTTGVVIPEGKLPADVGVLVFNVTTLATLARFVKTGMPLVEKCVTLDGSAVKSPMNIIAPVGAPISSLIEFAGGLTEGRCKVIMGGPMTGRAAASLSEPIGKTSNAVVILNEKDAMGKKMTHCIHCGKCVDACPLSLNPSAFTDAHNIQNVDDKMAMLEETRIMLCMECGSCAFACPAGRPIIESIRIEKNSYRDYKAHQASLKS